MHDRYQSLITGEGLAKIKHLPLETLEIIWAARGLRDDDLIYLKDMPLRKFTLVDCPHINGEGFRHFHSAQLKNVWLNHTKVNDAGISHLERMPIQNLSLIDTKITDGALAILARWPLRRLGLGRTEVTDQGIALLENCPLERLDLESLSVSESILDRFRRKNVKIIHKNAPSSSSLSVSGELIVEPPRQNDRPIFRELMVMPPEEGSWWKYITYTIAALALGWFAWRSFNGQHPYRSSK